MKNKKLLILFGAIFTLVLFIMSCAPQELASAKVYINQENMEKAEKKLKEAKEKYPENPEVYFVLASDFNLPRGEYEEALSNLQKAVELDSTYKPKVKPVKKKIWGEYQNKGADIFNKAQNAIMPEVQDSLLQESAKRFKKGLAIVDTSKNTYRGIIQAYFQMEDTSNVRKYTQKAMEHGIVTEKIISPYTSMFEDPSLALQEIDSILEDNPDFSILKIQKLNYMIKVEKYDEAEEYANQLLEDDPDNQKVRLLLAQIYLNDEQLKKAQSEYENLLEENPKDPTILSRVAHAYFQTKNYEKSKKYSQQYIDILEKQNKVEGRGFGYELLWKSLYNLGEEERAKELRKKAQQYK